MHTVPNIVSIPSIFAQRYIIVVLAIRRCTLQLQIATLNGRIICHDLRISDRNGRVTTGNSFQLRHVDSIRIFIASS